MKSSQCQQCQHVVKGVMRICPMCGGGMKGDNTQQNEQRQCPRCQTNLDIHHYNSFELDNCNTCNGLWIEPQEFNILTSEFDVFRDANSNPDYQKPSMPKSEGYLPCACCNKLMTRQNFKAISGVIIDMCINCGIWLDKGELQHIRDFIASGGLNKANERKLFQHDQQINALDDRVSDLELMEKMLNKFDVKRILFRGF